MVKRTTNRSRPTRKTVGFTLIELLVSLAIVALLISIVTPRYVGSLQTARETTLRDNLRILREMIDKHHADLGSYPQSLQDLVARRYIRSVPEDPITGSADTWQLIPSGDPNAAGTFDVRSGAEGVTRDGRAYGEL